MAPTYLYWNLDCFLILLKWGFCLAACLYFFGSACQFLAQAQISFLILQLIVDLNLWPNSSTCVFLVPFPQCRTWDCESLLYVSAFWPNPVPTHADQQRFRLSTVTLSAPDLKHPINSATSAISLIASIETGSFLPCLAQIVLANCLRSLMINFMPLSLWKCLKADRGWWTYEHKGCKSCLLECYVRIYSIVLR